METILIIIIISVLIGLAAFAWLMLIIIMATKKATNESVLKRWLRRNGLLIVAVVLLAGCSPGKMIGTGYLVSIDVEEPRDFQWQRFSAADSADAYIFRITQLDVSTPQLIGEDPPFYDISNDRFYIYVEKQTLYQRPGGKKHWKVYDQKLDSLTNKNQ